MIIKFIKEDSLKTKFTVIGIYLFSFLIIFESMSKVIYSYQNSTALDAINITTNVTSNTILISIFFLILTLIILLLFKKNISRLIILLISYTVILMGVSIFLKLLIDYIDYEYYSLDDFKRIWIQIIPNMIVVYLLINTAALKLYQVHSHKKEQQMLLFLTSIITITTLGFLYVTQ